MNRPTCKTVEEHKVALEYASYCFKSINNYIEKNKEWISIEDIIHLLEDASCHIDTQNLLQELNIKTTS
jgi:hypothetical protein